MRLFSSLVVLVVAISQIVSKYPDEIGVGDWHKVLVGTPLQVKSYRSGSLLVRTNLDNLAKLDYKDGSVIWRLAGKTPFEKLRKFDIIDDKRVYAIYDRYLRIYNEGWLEFDYQLPSTNLLPNLKFEGTSFYLTYPTKISKLQIGKLKSIWSLDFNNLQSVVDTFLNSHTLTLVSNTEGKLELVRVDIETGKVVKQTDSEIKFPDSSIQFVLDQDQLKVVFYDQYESNLVVLDTADLQKKIVYPIDANYKVTKLVTYLHNPSQLFVQLTSGISSEIHLIDVKSNQVSLVNKFESYSDNFIVDQGKLIQTGFDFDKVWIRKDGADQQLRFDNDSLSQGPVTKVFTINQNSALIITANQAVQYASLIPEHNLWIRDEYLVNTEAAAFIDYEDKDILDKKKLIVMWDQHHLTLLDFKGVVLARKYFVDRIIDLRVVESSHRSRLVLTVQGNTSYLVQFEDPLNLNKSTLIEMDTDFDHLVALPNQLVAVAKDNSVKPVGSKIDGVTSPTDLQLYHCEVKEDNQLYGYLVDSTGDKVDLRLNWYRNFTSDPFNTPMKLIFNQKSKLASLGVVQQDRTVLYKYTNPNLAVVITKTSKVTSEIQILDLITGNTLIHYHIDGSDVLAALNNNVLVYYHFDIKLNQPTLTKVELFNSEVPDLKPKELLNGKFTAFEKATPYTRTKATVLEFPISALAFTKSPLGVNPTRLLVTIFPTYQVLQLDLNTMRPTGFIPTKESNNNVISYNPTSVITYKLPVVGLSKLLTGFGIHYESQTTVLAFGQDLFFLTEADQPFDHLQPNFSKRGLLATIFVLVVALVIVNPMVKRKRLNEVWY